ncbi:VWA domain-containing protein [Luteolibacter sp. AS25]|uniref:vWA domain-containing protein n=1 Tax=Luteolibacter sp. AS25 TaxID=3135776 RepID=UPI00398B2186
MKKHYLISTAALAVFCLQPCVAKPVIDPDPAVIPAPDITVDGENRIQIALLLDTSNSMDGLIDQAKTQLWKVVNTFIEAERDGKAPFVEVALYEYGNNNNAVGNDWIRMVSPMSRDLDDISRKLFALKTNGGEEYCGAVIQRALGDLSWDKNKSTYKTIFIAGNEPFTQGRVDFRPVSKDALEKGITINSIHCGGRQAGISGSWHEAAALAGGDFLVIDQDKAIAHIDAPQDKKIAELSSKLNETYLGYGRLREEAQENQLEADKDALANKKSGASVQRAITKASQNYSNASWDLVDAINEKKIDPAKLKTEELPDEMKEMNQEERKNYIAETAKKRVQIQSEIKALNAEREDHIAAAMKDLAEDGSKTLDQAMISATRSQAAKLGYKFED